MPDEERPKHADQHAKPHEKSAAAEETAAVAAVDTAGGAISPSAVPATAQSGKLPGGPDTLLRKIFTGSGVVSVLAVLLALILGGLLIAAPTSAWRPPPAISSPGPPTSSSAVWNAATRSYVALFQGSVFNPRGPAWPCSSPR